MSCYTDGSPCDALASYFSTSPLVNGGHCALRMPGVPEAATVEVVVYPSIEYPNSLEKYPANAVMYPSTHYKTYPPTYQGGRSYSSPAAFGEFDHQGECGKEIVAQSCGSTIFGYYPNELSFQEMDSDNWFSFLYDTGSNGGAVGKPCYYVVTETELHQPSTGTVGSSTSKCYPCEAFSCTPARAYLKYTYNGPDETGDPDCPYPLIFGIGTDSNKIVVRYDQLSTIIPDVVTGLNFVYNGSETVAWSPSTLSGNPVITSDNPWEPGEETFTDFVIFQGSDLEGQTNTGLAVKTNISPALSQTDPVTFVGTKWEFLEIVYGGSNYSVGDEFTLNYDHTHPSGSITTLSINIKVTSIGPATSIGGSAEFDVLTQGDELNGHAVIGAFHTDMENFPYHVIYIDQNGAEFTKDTQYTSNRNHVVTVVAGYGIKDRAWFGGLYEFFDKSIQYTAHDVDAKHTNLFDDTRQPEITASISNGQLVGVTIEDGGKGWNLIRGGVELVVTSPEVATGKTAVVVGNFSGGVLTGVTILDRGSGYSSNNPPSLWVRGIYRKETSTSFEGSEDNYDYFVSQIEKTGGYSSFIDDYNAPGAQDLRRDGYKKQENTVELPAHRPQKDRSRKREIDLPQRKYRESEVEALKQVLPNYQLDISPQYVTPDFIERNNEFFDKNNQSMQIAADSLIQPKVPDSISYDEDYIETTQRRFLDMPKASRFTKYFVKQYRADSNQQVVIKVTLGSETEESGCGHVVCSPPPVPTDFSTTEMVGEEEVTNDYEYALLPQSPEGPGCQSWEAEGEMLIRHHMTKSTNTYKRTVESYGNPF